VDEVLFLAHRLPFPPNKGDKIRSYRWLRALATQYRVHVGTFIDDPNDWQHVDTLRELAGGEVCVLPRRKWTSLLRAGSALLRGSSLSLALFESAPMRAWVARILTERPVRRVALFSSSMAPYADGALRRGARVVADYCDVDSDKFRQYAVDGRWPASALFALEHRRLLAAEAKYVRAFATTTFISQAESELFRTSSGVPSDKLAVVANGVDTEFFDPQREEASPYADGQQAVVFVGAMDYRANVASAQWFVREVWSRVKTRCSRAQFYVVGSNPVPEVLALVRDSEIVVTGTVPDVRPYLSHASVVIAPLTIARGVQNKVLEAMAMAKPMVITPAATAGLPGIGALPAIAVASDAQSFADAVIQHLEAPPAAAARLQARQHVQEAYSWTHCMERFASLVAGKPVVVNAIASTKPAAVG
jgi:sugar transferase (PEP-CTERM/EpsH1 system associated)